MVGTTTDANELKEIAVYLLGKIDSCTSILGLHSRHWKKVSDTNRLEQIITELDNEEFLKRIEEIHEKLGQPVIEGPNKVTDKPE